MKVQCRTSFNRKYVGATWFSSCYQDFVLSCAYIYKFNANDIKIPLCYKKDFLLDWPTQLSKSIYGQSNNYLFCLLLSSVPSKAVCRGLALWKIGSTDFLKMSKDDAFSLIIKPIFSLSKLFWCKNPPILSNLLELAQAQKPSCSHQWPTWTHPPRGSSKIRRRFDVESKVYKFRERWIFT